MNSRYIIHAAGVWVGIGWEAEETIGSGLLRLDGLEESLFGVELSPFFMVPPLSTVQAKVTHARSPAVPVVMLLAVNLGLTPKNDRR